MSKPDSFPELVMASAHEAFVSFGNPQFDEVDRRDFQFAYSAAYEVTNFVSRQISNRLLPPDSPLFPTVRHGILTASGAAIQLARIYPDNNPELFISALTSERTQDQIFNRLATTKGSVAVVLEGGMGITFYTSRKAAINPVQFRIDNTGGYFEPPLLVKAGTRLAHINRGCPFKPEIANLSGAFAEKYNEMGILGTFLQQR